MPLAVVQIDPRIPATMLAGTASAQLYRSEDRGENWIRLPFPMALKSTLHAILIDPTRPDTYLAAVSSEAPQNAGLFRTTDAGLTWQPVPGLSRKQIWSLAYWPGDPNIIAAGAAEGVFLSRDGGDTWEHTGRADSIYPHPVVSLTFDPQDRNTLYAGTPHLAWKSSDGGSTWRRLSKGMLADSDIFSIHVDPGRRTRVFAGACSGVYRSLDGGRTWSTLEQALGGSFRTYTITRSAAVPNVVFAGTSDGLIRSLDKGETWQRLYKEPVRAIAFDPIDPQRMFVATDRGILLSDDAGAHFRCPVAKVANR